MAKSREAERGAAFCSLMGVVSTRDGQTEWPERIRPAMITLNSRPLAPAAGLLAVGGQEGAEATDRVGQDVHAWQRDDPEVIGVRPVEAAAMGHQDLLGSQQV